MEGGKNFFKKKKDFQFKCTLHKDSVVLNGKLKKKEQLFQSIIKVGHFPPSFTNILDHLDEVYNFLENQSEQDFTVERNLIMVKFRLDHLNKTKLIEIPIKTKDYGKEEKIEFEIDQLKERVQKLEDILSENYIQNIVQNILNKRMTKDQFMTKSSTDQKSLFTQKRHNQANQRKEVIVQESTPIQNQQIKDPFSKLNILQKVNSHQFEHSKSFSFSPNDERLNNSLSFQEVSGNNIAQDFSTRDFTFEVDLRNKYIQNYIVNKNQVTKRTDDDKTYQVYSMNPIPDRYRHRISFTFTKISPKTSAAFGLITEEKKILQYIYKEQGTVSMGCDGGYEVYIGNKPEEIMLTRVKDKTLMEIQIDIKRNRIRFFKHGNHQTPLVKVDIPQSMKNKKIYPFFQLTAKGDSVDIWKK